MRLLLVTHRTLTEEAVHKVLALQGFAIDVTESVQEAIRHLEADVYDCVVMPSESWDGGALDVIAEVREYEYSTSVLVVHDEDDGAERAELMAAGADDCITGPPHPGELAIRAMRLALMASPPAEAQKVKLGTVEIDLSRRELFVDGEPLEVSPTGFMVLGYMMRHHGRLVSVQELIDHCWDHAAYHKVNPVHSQITRLRRALEDHLEIEMVHGLGYRLRVLREAETD